MINLVEPTQNPVGGALGRNENEEGRTIDQGRRPHPIQQMC